jgi:hypothetical protein
VYRCRHERCGPTQGPAQMSRKTAVWSWRRERDSSSLATRSTRRGVTTDHSSRHQTSGASEDGGERGIRTLGRVSPTHAFQACSFNHSDISPYLESTTCEQSISDYRTRRRIPGRPAMFFVFNKFDAPDADRQKNCVRPENPVRSLTAFQRCRRRGLARSRRRRMQAGWASRWNLGIRSRVAATRDFNCSQE